MKRLPTAAFSAVLLSGLLAGCGSGPGPYAAQGTAAPDAELCSSVDDLQASVQALQDVDVVQDGTDAVSEAMGGVRDDLEQVARDAQDRYRESVEQVQASADAVRDAVRDAGSDPTTTTLSAVRTALRSFGTDVRSLVKEVDPQC